MVLKTNLSYGPTGSCQLFRGELFNFGKVGNWNIVGFSLFLSNHQSIEAAVYWHVPKMKLKIHNCKSVLSSTNMEIYQLAEMKQTCPIRLTTSHIYIYIIVYEQWDNGSPYQLWSCLWRRQNDTSKYTPIFHMSNYMMNLVAGWIPGLKSKPITERTNPRTVLWNFGRTTASLVASTSLQTYFNDHTPRIGLVIFIQK